MQAEISWDRLDKSKLVLWGAVMSSGVGACLYPLSVIKTRQMATDNQAAGLRGVQNTIRQIYMQNGILGFYKGLATVLIGTIPARTIYLVSMEVVKSNSAHQLKNFNLNEQTVLGISGFLGGATASMIAQAVTVPVDVISQRRIMQNDNRYGSNMQANMKVPQGASPENAKQLIDNKKNLNMGGARMVQHIIKTEGIRGLFRGFFVSLATSVPSGSIWWGSYSFYKATISLYFNKALLPYRLPILLEKNKEEENQQRAEFLSQQRYNYSSNALQVNHIGTSSGLPQVFNSIQLQQRQQRKHEQGSNNSNNIYNNSGSSENYNNNNNSVNENFKLKNDLQNNKSLLGALENNKQVIIQQQVTQQQPIGGVYRSGDTLVQDKQIQNQSDENDIEGHIPKASFNLVPLSTYSQNQVLQDAENNIKLKANQFDKVFCLSQNELLGIQIMSSMMAGVTSSLALNPLDIVKTRIQISNQLYPGSNPRVLTTVRDIYSNDGIMGFWRGFIPKLFSTMLWGTAMVTVYELMKVLASKDDV